MDQSSSFHRKNGLQWPLDIRQVMVWILLSMSCTVFYTYHISTLEKKDRIFWGILYGLSLFCGVILFVFTTLTEHILPPPTSPDHRHFCVRCKEYVPDTAKHCRMCNKCRLGFDHHCRFVNNCITISNYQSFFYGLLFLISALVIAIVHLVYTAVKYSSQKEQIFNRMETFFHHKVNAIIFWIFFSLSSLLHLGLFAPLSTLIGFHVFFQRLNISTFNFILKNYADITPNLKSFCLTPKPKVHGEE